MTPDNLNSLTKPDLFEKFKVQVFKDFELAGVVDCTPEFSSNDLSEIKLKFHDTVIKLERLNALQNVLYRIDITEHQIKKYSKEQPTVDLHHIIAELMIKRILQKVVFKQLYS